MGFGISRPPLLGCTGTSVRLEETPTTSPSSGSPPVELALASRCHLVCLSNSFVFLDCIKMDFSCLRTKTLTPHNKGMIRRAISQSGMALCPWGVNRNPRRFAEEVQDALSTQLAPLPRGWDLILKTRVCRLLWRSTVPLTRKWPPVWRWLTPSCSHWPVLWSWAAPPTVRTQR